jgi:hypothetical protein
MTLLKDAKHRRNGRNGKAKDAMDAPDCSDIPSRPWLFHGVHRVEVVRELQLGVEAS